MMKNKIWLFQIPMVVLFTFAFWVFEAGVSGDLHDPFLRDTVYGKLRTLSGAFTDLKFRTRGPRPPRNKIVIVTVDDQSIEEVGRWPWSREVTGYLIHRIFESGAKIVGLDMVFSEPARTASLELEDHLKSTNQGHLLEQFNEDAKMELTVKAYQRRLVLGWASNGACQPTYDKSEACLNPAALEGQESHVPKQMKKYAFDIFKKPSEFQENDLGLVKVTSFLNNIDRFDEYALYSGFFNGEPESDGIVRRANLVMTADGRAYPSLALAMARAELGERLELELGRDHKIKHLRFANSGRSIPVSALGMIDVNFRGPGYTFPYVNASSLIREDEKVPVLQGRILASATSSFEATMEDPKAILKDAIVLLGVSALGVFDMRAFPFGTHVPGVEGHANILDNLLSGDMLTSGSGTTRAVWLFIFMTVGALLFAYLTERLESIPALVLFIFVMSGISITDLKLLFANDINWNTSLLYIEMVSIFSVTMAAKYVLEERNKKFIKGAFAKYVAPAIIDSIMKDPSKLSVGGEKRDMSILFSDIRGFTTFSERLDAKQLAGFLNDYLGIMTDIVFENEGTLDKYIGDAVMAFWGAPLDQPNHAANACKAAIKMLHALNQNQQRFKDQYGVEVNIGIGINSGPVNVGNMGSERIFEYTVIGDHVNLSSRLEGLTKYYGAGIITSRFTFDMIQQSGEVQPPHRVLDFVKVKGKKNAVELIQVLEREYSADGLRRFEEGRILYNARDWDGAITKFEAANELLRQNSDEPDAPSVLYADRCKEFKLNPPDADWDGSWEMTSK